MSGDVTYVGYGAITKANRQPDGTLDFEVTRATDETIDADDQIVDAAWAKGEMASWFATAGNLREMHQNIAAGRGLELHSRSDGEYVSGKVVDPTTALKVEHDVLTGLSIGIRNPRIVKDDKARGGRIVGGRIVEVSLVDRPANPNCRLTLAKMDGAGNAQFVEELVEKKAGSDDPAPLTTSVGDLLLKAVATQGGTFTVSNSGHSTTMSAVTPADVARRLGKAAAPADPDSGGDNSGDSPAVDNPRSPVSAGAPDVPSEDAEEDVDVSDDPTDPEPADDTVKAVQVDVAALTAMSADMLGEMLAALKLDGLPDVAKRAFSPDARRGAASSGAALGDGSFPIQSKGDLMNAIKAFGRAKDKAAAKAHIIARAKALGATGMLPPGWAPSGKKAQWLVVGTDVTKVDDDGDDEGSDIAIAGKVLEGLAHLIRSEAMGLIAGDLGEIADIQCLADCAATIKYFIWKEQQEDEMADTAKSGDGAAAPAAKADTADATKTNGAPTATTPVEPIPPVAPDPVVPPADPVIPPADPAAPADLGTQIAEKLEKRYQETYARLTAPAAVPDAPGAVDTLSKADVAGLVVASLANTLPDALTKALGPVADRLAQVEATLASTPRGGGPAVRAVTPSVAKAAGPTPEAEVVAWLSKADAARTVGDTLLADGRRERAAEVAKDAGLNLRDIARTHGVAY